MGKTGVKFMLFSIGGTLYGIIEILWRGYTNLSMFFAGGICFIMFSKIAQRFKGFSLAVKALLGSFVVTATELIFGIIFNIILGKKIWDYSKQPLNFLGQICALYSFFWFLISLIGIPFAALCNKRLQNTKK